MKTTIVLDAMGSDKRPQPEVEASVQCAETLGVDLILVGDEAVLQPLLAAQPGDKSHVRIVHAPEALEMSDHIAEARAKRNNTMQVGINLVRSGEAQAFVTAGNTGMAMYFATKTFGLIPGVIRPCLCGTFPVKNGKCVILDIGANAECRPEFLVQFAHADGYLRPQLEPEFRESQGCGKEKNQSQEEPALFHICLLQSRWGKVYPQNKRKTTLRCANPVPLAASLLMVYGFLHVRGTDRGRLRRRSQASSL